MQIPTSCPTTTMLTVRRAWRVVVATQHGREGSAWGPGTCIPPQLTGEEAQVSPLREALSAPPPTPRLVLFQGLNTFVQLTEPHV